MTTNLFGNFLVRVAFLFCIVALNPISAIAANYYLSAAGNDGGDGSEAQPWASFQHAFTQLGPGDVLIVKDGLYSEPLAPSVSGQPDNPIRIYAENDGKVIIETVDEPAIYISNKNYITIEGIFARTSGENATVYVGGHDGPDWSDKTTGIILRRVSVQGSSLMINSSAFHVARVDNVLLEDVWSFGHARNTMAVYGSDNVTVRRAVIRWDGWYGYDYKPDDPRVGLTVYNTHNSVFENIVVIDGGKQGADTFGERVALAISGNNNGETAPFIDSSNNSFHGVILLNNVGKGLNAESGEGILLNNYIEHLVSWDNSAVGYVVNRNADGTSLVHGTVGFNNQGVRYSPYHNVLNSYLYSTLVMSNRKAEEDGGTSVGYWSTGEDATNDHNNYFDHQVNYTGTVPGANDISIPITMEYIVEIPDSVNTGAGHDGDDIGATVVNRWVDGIETDQPLWPYPLEDRIKSEMCDPVALVNLGRTADNVADWCETSKTLTEYIWEYLGNPTPDHIYDGNSPPQIQWLQPVDQAQYYPGQDITLEANASDSDGHIQSVEFYSNGSLLGIVNQAPYIYNWSETTVGTHVLTAVATDNEGLTTSADIEVAVLSELVAVATSESTSYGQIQNGSYVDTHTASGSEVLIEQLSGGKPSRRVSKLAHQWLITGVVPGESVELFIDAEAPANSDNDNYAFSYSVNGGASQTIGQLNQGERQQFFVALSPATTGTVTVLVEDTNQSTSGNHQVDAVIVNQITITTSGSPTNQAPVLSIDSPADGAVFDAGTTIVFSASATDEDGDLSSEINWSSTPAGVSGTGASISFDNLAIGTYTVTAQVSDSAGLTTQKSVVINVVEPSSATLIAVSDLDGIGMAGGGRWSAEVTIEVRDDESTLISGAVVSGYWTNKSSQVVSCTTDGVGRCTVTQDRLKNNRDSVAFGVVGITGALPYQQAANSDPDGDSDGTMITLFKP
ncbi:MAG TPA: hypothetical protein DIT58_16305 [Porticoccaceae bacterium]|nr:hypothetical protein [Porticoccaceae bacterium]